MSDFIQLSDFGFRFHIFFVEFWFFTKLCKLLFLLQEISIFFQAHELYKGNLC